VTRDNALRLDYRAVSDRPTVVNLTNHAYFALQGEGNGDISEQRMQVFADRYTPSDADGLPTGAIASVANTPLDFRTPVRLGDILDSSFEQIAQRAGLDINMIVNGMPGVLRPAARITDPTTGIVHHTAWDAAVQRQCHPHHTRQARQAIRQPLFNEFRDPALPRLAQSAGIPVHGGDTLNPAA
jgi:hypothetical protein